MHWLDRSLGRLAASWRLFPDGWGEPRILQGFTRALLPALPEAPVVHWTGEGETAHGRVLTGWFDSPAAIGPLPAFAHQAWFQLHLPKDAGDRPPLALPLPAFGGVDFGWREALIGQLASRGIATLILEQAFEGRRRGNGAPSALPRTVAEWMLQCRATVVESSALVGWALARGHGKVVLTGIGVGATLAATVGAAVPLEVAMAPVGPSSGLAPLLLEGVLSRGIDFTALGGTATDAEKSARQRLAELLTSTSLLEVNPPARPRRAIFVAARQDGVVPPSSTLRLLQHWPGAELRTVPRGHVATVLAGRDFTVKALLDSLERIAPTPKTPEPFALPVV